MHYFYFYLVNKPNSNNNVFINRPVLSPNNIVNRIVNKSTIKKFGA